MKYLTSRIALALIKLLPERRDKRRFLFFTLLASSTSILELGIAKVFSEIILGQDNQFNNFASLLFTFLLLSVVSKLAIYLQRTRRIEVFSDTHINEEGKSKTNTWNITLGIECSNIANPVIQVILIVVFISALSPAFGISTSFMIVLLFAVFSSIFIRQERFQTKMLVAHYRKEQIDATRRISTRIKSGELGALVANLSMISLLFLLVALNYFEWIPTTDTIVSFFAIRLLGTNLSSLSSSLMRFARALVNSSFGTTHLTRNLPDDETLLA